MENDFDTTLDTAVQAPAPDDAGLCMRDLLPLVQQEAAPLGVTEAAAALVQDPIITFRATPICWAVLISAIQASQAGRQGLGTATRQLGGTMSAGEGATGSGLCCATAGDGEGAGETTGGAHGGTAFAKGLQC